PIYQSFCNGHCISTVGDPQNCGGCGVMCTGGQACSAGRCSTSCLPRSTICSGSCVDLPTSNEHCGGRPNARPPGTRRVFGTCLPAAGGGPGPMMCPNGGPPTGDNGMCNGNMAQTTFRWNLCSCTNTSFGAELLTDAYDSTMGPYMPGGLGGGVALDGT